MKKLLIFVLAVAFVAAGVLPAMAQEKEVNLYGSVRMETFYRSTSKEAADRGGGLDKDETTFTIGDSSRFGANFKAGNMSANVELRPQGGGEGGSSMNFRQWWGQVDFTGWQLRVGQQSVIDGLFPPGCCIDEGSVQSSFGGWSGRVRQPGLAAFIPIGQGTFKFGLFSTGSGAGASGADTTAGSPVFGYDAGTDEVIPQIQASYDIKFGPAAVKFVAGYNTYDEVYWASTGSPTTDVTYSIDAWIIGGQAEANFGPLTVMWQIHYAQNAAAYRQSTSGGALVLPAYDVTGNGIQDVSEWGTFGRFIYKMSDMVTWEVGGGYLSQTRDGTPSLDKIDDDSMFLYLNAQIFLAKTFRFTPEIGYFDYRSRDEGPTTTIEQGDQFYWGAYWRIDF